MLDRSARPLLSALLFATVSFGTAFAPAHAQLRVEITRRRIQPVPDRDRAVPRAKTAVPQEVTPVIARRPRAQRAVHATSTPAGRPRRRTQPQDQSTATWQRARRRRARHRLVTRLADGRYDVRFRLDGRRSSRRSSRRRLQRRAVAAAAHRAQDRRRHLREAHRRARRVRHAHHLRREERPQRATSCRSPTPTASTRRPVLRSRRADHLAVVVARRHALAYVSFEREKPVVYVQSLTTGQRKRGREFPRQQQRAGVVAPDGRPLAVVLTQGRRLADLLDHPPTAAATPRASRRAPGDRHRADLLARRQVDLIFTSDRGGSPQIYRMPATGGQPQRAHLRGDLQRHPAPQPRRQELRLRASAAAAASASRRRISPRARCRC